MGHALGYLGRRNSQDRRRLCQRCFVFSHKLERGGAGQRRYATCAGRHALLADNFEQSHLTAVVQMRSAAQLFAEFAD